jgi:hypothetical protein
MILEITGPGINSPLIQYSATAPVASNTYLNYNGTTWTANVPTGSTWAWTVNAGAANLIYDGTKVTMNAPPVVATTGGALQVVKQLAAGGAYSSATLLGTEMPWSGAVNQVAYWSGTNTLTGGANWTFDGTNQTSIGFHIFSSATEPAVSSAHVGYDGSEIIINVPTGKGIDFTVNGVAQAFLNTTGLVVGGSSPTRKLELIDGGGNAQLRLTFTATTKFAEFKMDTSQNLTTTLSTSGTGGNSFVWQSGTTTGAWFHQFQDSTTLRGYLGVNSSTGTGLLASGGNNYGVVLRGEAGVQIAHGSTLIASFITTGLAVNIAGGVGVQGYSVQAGTWTTGAWTRGVELPSGAVVRFAKNSSYSWGIGSVSGKLYFPWSTADDGSAAQNLPWWIEASTWTTSAFNKGPTLAASSVLRFPVQSGASWGLTASSGVCYFLNSTADDGSAAANWTGVLTTTGAIFGGGASFPTTSTYRFCVYGNSGSGGNKSLLALRREDNYSANDEAQLDFTTGTTVVSRISNYFSSGSLWGLKFYSYNAGINANPDITLVGDKSMNICQSGGKLGFFTTAPVVQQTNAVAVATTASTQTTPYGYTTQAQADSIPVAINAIRTALLNLGLAV